MINLADIAKEHAKIFPQASAESQLTKYKEEIAEFNLASRNKDFAQEKKELADCFIVLGGLYRFYKEIAESAGIGLLYVADTLNISEFTLTIAIVDKMEINAKRKWQEKDGTYKHIGKDGNE